MHVQASVTGEDLLAEKAGEEFGGGRFAVADYCGGYVCFFLCWRMVVVLDGRDVVVTTTITIVYANVSINSYCAGGLPTLTPRYMSLPVN